MLAHRDTAEGGEHDPDERTVGDHEHELAVMCSRDPLELGQRSPLELLERLAAGPPVPLRGRAALVGVRPALSHLVEGEPCELTDIDLAKGLTLHHRETQACPDTVGRFRRTTEVARIHGDDRLSRQAIGEGFCLLDTDVVEWTIGLSLVAVLGVPVRLAVAREEDPGRRHPSRLARVDLGLTGKVALVTGSSRGIGRAIAARLVEEGADVVFTARGAEALEEAVSGARGPGRAEGVVVDLTEPDGAERVVAAAIERFGGLDIVVNNVGGSGARSFDAMDVADLETVLGRNVFPALGVSRAAVPSLRERGGGVILMIASIYGREGGGGPSYNVAKAAEISLAKAMAIDLAKDGIRVLSVAPGSTLFPGGSWERRSQEDPDAIAAFVERELPWGRFGTVDEIADVVAFLVSPRASWVVGTCVTVDGGQSRSF